jgi:hypothetical protein
MTLLFLIEEGVNLTVGLQGDVEYIPFKRNNPSDSFTKIVEVIGSIKREAKEIGSEGSVAPLPAKKEDIEKEAEQKAQLEPDQEKFLKGWSALHKSIEIDKNLPEASKRLKEILVEFGENKLLPPIYWKSLSSYFKVKAGYAEGLDELKELCVKNPDNAIPLHFFADSLRELKQYTQAAEQYLNVSRMERGIKSIQSVAKAAEAFRLEDKPDLAIDLLLKEFLKVLSQEETNYLYLQLANIFKRIKNNFLFGAFAEKTLEYFPLDHDLRFALAYHYGESKSVASSLFHYDFLRAHRPEGYCLNNLGVAYAYFKMKNKAVQSYKESMDQYQETLAMANLAAINIEAGLLDEAQSILEKATGIADYHKNIDLNRNKVKEVREEEDKEKMRIIEESKIGRKFLARFAEAYSLPQVVSIQGHWESMHGVIPIKVEGEIVSGQKDEELAITNALAPLALIAPQSGTKRISLSGKINNRGIEYQLSIEILRPSQSLLGAGSTVFKGLMIISTNGQLIEVMEKGDDGKESFYEMKKVG